ncbi:hypothetical protein SOV_22870 [Sporomusa ovata DSM 2662]|uniref:Uncharacterized protein n=1 Tax=Sporomusa ovata TaxID=2378 RepID=A0A0U1L387_9FIRM|nr:hypothetical protein [Sporomusa ovata]EQB25603.1 hypothetical protein SOV_4c02660 [Sporomusa ovata DSM 2662]CQR74161.1 hypothetical protein SpAn4DRAFT_0623 [Sporomusa ovata]
MQNDAATPNFKFNEFLLQRFNDTPPMPDGTASPESSPAPVVDQQPAPSAQPDPQPAPQPATNQEPTPPQKQKLGLVFENGKPRLKPVTAQQEPTVNEPTAINQPAGQLNEPNSAANPQLMPPTIPEPAKGGENNLNTEIRDMLQQIINKAVTPPQSENPSVQESPPNPMQYVDDVLALATDNVKKMFGTEDYDDYDMRQRAALQIEVNRIMSHVQTQMTSEQAKLQQEQQEVQKQQELTNRFNSEYAEATKDPNYNAIDELMGTKLQEMSFSKAAPIVDAISRLKAQRLVDGDIDLLKGFYSETRQEYYAKANGVPMTPQQVQQKPSVKPPVVENGGQGQNPVKQPTDWSQLRGMSKRERAVFLTQHVNLNQRSV